MARGDSKQRERILDAAATVFGSHGLKGATIRRVAHAAGVNSALIYYYFENKQALFTEAIGMVVRGFLQHLRARTRAFHGARDRLSFLVDGILDYYTAHPNRMRLMSVALNLHGGLFGQALSSALKDQTLLPLNVLEDGIAQGELKRVHPLHAWWSVLGLCFFSLSVAEVMAHVEVPTVRLPPFDLKDRRTQIVDILTDGLALPPERTQGKTRSRT